MDPEPSGAATSAVAAAAASTTAIALFVRGARGVQQSPRAGARRSVFVRRCADAQAPPFGEGPFFQDWAEWLVPYCCKELQLEDDPSTPSEYACKTGSKGAKISSRVLTPMSTSEGACRVRRLRVTLVDHGTEVQAMNAALYPNPDLGPLPILGVDLIALNRGKRLLFGVDWAPASPDCGYHAERIKPFLEDLRQAHACLETDVSGKIYGGRPEFFSPSMFFSRPDHIESFAKSTELWDVFQGYCERYVGMLQVAPTIGDPTCRHSTRQDEYDCWHAERDPALPIFRRLFGEDWTHRYVVSVLFPGAGRLQPSRDGDEATS